LKSFGEKISGNYYYGEAMEPVFPNNSTSADMNPQDANPLLRRSGLPAYDEILPSHIGPAVDHVLAEATAIVKDLELSNGPRRCNNFAALLESMD
jgi:Zn-dependent oligopeptidase